MSNKMRVGGRVVIKRGIGGIGKSEAVTVEGIDEQSECIFFTGADGVEDFAIFEHIEKVL